MQGRLGVIAWALCVFAALVAGCAYPSSPKGWLPPADAAGRSLCGGWAEVWTSSIWEDPQVFGELIAVDDEWMSVLTMQNQIVTVARNKITRADVFFYEADLSSVTSVVLLGTLSTISHGFILILTAPLWLIFGLTGISMTSREPRQRYEPSYYQSNRPVTAAWLELAAYARFPQGMPSGVENLTWRGPSLGGRTSPTPRPRSNRRYTPGTR